MFHTTTAPLHKAWNCQWCRPGDRYLEVPEHLQREGRWICVRTRERRRQGVTDTECAECPHWHHAENK